MVKKLWSVFANSKKNLNDCDEYNNNSIIIIVMEYEIIIIIVIPRNFSSPFFSFVSFSVCSVFFFFGEVNKTIGGWKWSYRIGMFPAIWMEMDSGGGFLELRRIC